MSTVRTAAVRGARDVEQVQRYMPANYEAWASVDGEIFITGRDVAGWTLDDYVIPRLASGLIFAEEVTVPEAIVNENWAEGTSA